MKGLFYFIILVTFGCKNHTKQNSSTGQPSPTYTVGKRDTTYHIPERTCDCAQLLERSEQGLYVYYLEGVDTMYSGKCTEKNDKGYSQERHYLAGHTVATIEYKAGSIDDEMYYDTTGNLVERTRYYANGKKAYVLIKGDHSYETFYENGSIESKCGYGFTEKDRLDREYDKDTKRLTDSFWNKDGSFDRVRLYSKGDIIY